MHKLNSGGLNAEKNTIHIKKLKLCLPPTAMVATKDIEPLLIIVGKFDNATGMKSSVPSQVPSTVPSVC